MEFKYGPGKLEKLRPWFRLSVWRSTPNNMLLGQQNPRSPGANRIFSGVEEKKWIGQAVSQRLSFAVNRTAYCPSLPGSDGERVLTGRSVKRVIAFTSDSFRSKLKRRRMPIYVLHHT